MVNLLSFKLAEYIDAQGKPRPFFEMINVFDRDGRQWTTSLNVAEVFDREHKDVLDKIDNCLCSQEFSRRNFTPSDYIDSRGKTQRCFEMTRDGFSFLVI